MPKSNLIALTAPEKEAQKKELSEDHLTQSAYCKAGLGLASMDLEKVQGPQKNRKCRDAKPGTNVTKPGGVDAPSAAIEIFETRLRK